MRVSGYFSQLPGNSCRAHSWMSCPPRSRRSSPTTAPSSRGASASASRRSGSDACSPTRRPPDERPRRAVQPHRPGGLRGLRRGPPLGRRGGPHRVQPCPHRENWPRRLAGLVQHRTTPSEPRRRGSHGRPRPRGRAPRGPAPRPTATPAANPTPHLRPCCRRPTASTSPSPLRETPFRHPPLPKRVGPYTGSALSPATPRIRAR